MDVERSYCEKESAGDSNSRVGDAMVCLIRNNLWYSYDITYGFIVYL